MALDIRKVQSKNEVYINGVLKQLKIEPKTTGDGRDYVSGTATIRVDQEINGQVFVSEIPVRMFSMRLKGDQTLNANYDRILGYQNSFTSMDAVDDPAKASRVTFGAQVTSLKESAFYDAKTNKLIEKGFQIEGNFMNAARDNEREGAEFEVTGVVAKMYDETDKEGQLTGRLLIDLVLVGYKGTANVITLTAVDNGKAYIETNYKVGDTVTLTGDIIMSFEDEEVVIEQAFGKPKIKHNTKSTRTLLINGGSPTTIDPERSYDADDIKMICTERAAAHAQLKEKATKTTKTTTPDFGF